MTTRAEICRRAGEKLAACEPGKIRTLIGFDGFVDEIIDVVGKRLSADSYSAIETIEVFGGKISGAAGKSANFELVTREQRRGGNAPIMADAIASLGFGTTFIGTVGRGGPVHPVFEQLGTRAELISIASPARTYALEFTDGKIMLGNLTPLSDVTWERIVEVVGMERLAGICEGASLLGLANWTMVPHMTGVWEGVLRDVLPRLTKKGRRVFIDLADPEKRLPGDILAALGVLQKINALAPVTLGLNLSEADQVARVLALPGRTAGDLAVKIQEKLGLDTVVVHPRFCAAAAQAGGVAEFDGPFTGTPKISTGAGDHFNAGFAAGQLIGMSLEECLAMGTGISGYYVRNAVSPTQGELAGFIRELPEPQAGA